MHPTQPAVLVAGEDGWVRAYHLNSSGNSSSSAGGQQPFATLRTADPTMQTDECAAVAVSDDGLQVAAASPTGAVRLWDLRAAVPLSDALASSPPPPRVQLPGSHLPRADEGALALTFAPRWSRRNAAPLLVSGGADGAVRLNFRKPEKT